MCYTRNSAMNSNEVATGPSPANKLNDKDLPALSEISSRFLDYEDPQKADIVMTVIIGVMAMAIIFLWIEYTKLKNNQNGRKLSRMLQEGPKEVQEHLQEALSEVKEFVVPSKLQRFRKRDRFYFYGKKVIRKMRENVETFPGNRKRAVSRLTKNLLRTHSSSEDGSEEAVGVGRAEDYLDEDVSEHGDPWTVSPELEYLLNSFHMFGHFDKAIFLELWKSVETVTVASGQYLFNIGDRDEFIYVIQSGCIDIHIRGSDRSTTIKTVHPGETASSLLSFIDVLTGTPNPYKTVAARAVGDSVVLKLPAQAFQEIFSKNPDTLVRVVQMIMARLQRVVFVALHQYLGLTSELIREIPESSEWVSCGEDPDVIAQDGLASREVMMNVAVRAFQQELNLNNLDYLRESIELRTLNSGDMIMTEDSHSDAALVYIISGSLRMSQKGETESGGERTLYTAKKGESVGQLAMLTGEPNFYSCIAVEPSTVAMLTKESFFHIVTETPEMVLSLAHSTIRRLSPLVRQFDFALDWINIESGKALFRERDPTDGVFIVLSGRLRSVITTQAGKKHMVDEYTRGEMVGIVDFVTSSSRHETVMAVRDSELCKVPSNLLTLLKARYPVVVSKLISLLGHKLIGSWKGQSKIGRPDQVDGSQSAYTTVALFPATKNVPLSAFAFELAHATSVIGPVIRLSSTVVLQKLGPTALEPNYEYRLNSWLGQQEHRHKVVLYQCDHELTKWTRQCLRQADVIFVVVVAANGPEVSKAETDLLVPARRVRKELVFLHDEKTECPSNTREWLRKRHWVSSHFHIKAPKRLFLRKSEERLSEYYQRLILTQDPNIHSDFSRLARHVTGMAVGLVLGGGGARGAAHIGMIKAIREAGIPIDKVGGVSIGAFVGGLWASRRDMTYVTQKSRRWFDLLGKEVWASLLDFTYPITSLFSGSYFNWTITETFGKELHIEDLWLPYYCVTTDVSASQERIHTKGVFWRYCRGSMSYAWLLPPICDPQDGHLLMDGCYVNNVPGDIMTRNRCKYILAVDVTSVDDRNLTNYGDTLSGWWLLWKRLNPFSTPVKIPDQSEIQMRLAFCSHYKNLEELKNNPNCEYIQPPIERYAAGSFKLFDEIRDVGYHHGTTFFTGLRKAGSANTNTIRQTTTHTPPWAASPGSSPGSQMWFPGGSTSQWSRSRAAARRDSGNYTFTDLAEMVSQNLYSGSSDLSLMTGFRSRTPSTASGPRQRSSRKQSALVQPHFSYMHQPDEPDLEDSDDTGIML